MKFTRKKLIFSGIAAAGVIGVSSVAFACLVTVGQITVTGNLRAGNTVKNTNANHGFCTNPTVEARASVTNGKVTVVVAPNNTCSSTTQLASGNARVVIQADNANPAWTWSSSQWNFFDGHGCFAGAGSGTTYTLATTYNISAAGYATATFNVPAGISPSDADEAGHVCVRDSGGKGAFAPITFF